MRLTLKAVNQEINKYGYTVYFENGGDSPYLFPLENSPMLREDSLNVYRLNHCVSIENIVNTLFNRIEEVIDYGKYLDDFNQAVQAELIKRGIESRFNKYGFRVSLYRRDMKINSFGFNEEIK